MGNQTFYSKQLNQKLIIQKKLGEGAFGLTYLVCDENQKEYVLKVLKLKDVDHWKVIDRFNREIAVLKQLDHPNIPKYYDSIEMGESPGILQEYIKGKSFQQIISGNFILKKSEWASCLKQGLEILEYLKAFQPPVIHRDISPKNLMMTDEGKLYLIDFGGVQFALTENSETVTSLGTFGYMAPEQVMGNAIVQSDLYSFGMSR